MNTYEELKEKIDELENTNFNFEKQILCGEEMYVSSLFRKALIYSNEIYRLKNEDKKLELNNQLDTILFNKIKDLNPDFDNNIIKETLCCYKRGIFQYPMDIFVIDDAVFTKEGTYDDFGFIYKVKTFMFKGRNYLNIFDMEFCFEDSFARYFDENYVNLSKQDQIMVSDFISKNINSTLYNEYKCNVTRPLYELNENGVFYGYDGLTQGDIKGVNILLDTKFRDIAISIRNKSECDIKMCVQNRDDISMYKIHQTFVNNKPIWKTEKLDLPIWKLSEEAIKKENNSSKDKQKVNVLK